MSSFLKILNLTKIALLLLLSFSMVAQDDDGLQELQNIRNQQMKQAGDLQKYVQKMQEEGKIPNTNADPSRQQQPQMGNVPQFTNEKDIFGNTEGGADPLADKLEGIQKGLGLSDENVNSGKQLFAKYIKPILNKVISIVQNPNVLGRLMEMMELNRQKKMYLFQFGFIVFIFFFRIYINGKAKKWTQKLKNFFIVFATYIFGSTLVVPIIVYRGYYTRLLKAIYEAL
ncbi:MAG: hypothetical protein HOO06_11550 [Bdellovibrionaceae bacterium]|jgi:hypothetical protein|nr:hypothetical protein [Pseudobdellovibrionaceae bacterium]